MNINKIYSLGLILLFDEDYEESGHCRKIRGPWAYRSREQQFIVSFYISFFQIFSRYISNLNIEPLIGLGFSLESQFKYSYNVI